MIFQIILFGFIFGYAMQIAKLNKFNAFAGAGTLESNTLMKAFLLAVGIGIFLVMLLVDMQLADLNIKRLYLLSVLAGALLFGVGLALVGYCPLSLAISVGQGAIDALFGIAGGLTGGFVASLIIMPILPYMGPHFTEISLYSIKDDYPWLFYSVAVVLGLGLIWLAFYANKKKKSFGPQWIWSGILLAFLSAGSLTYMVMGRAVGASAAYSWLVSRTTFLQEGIYYQFTQMQGRWEFYFLIGAFMSGLVISLLRGKFKLQWKHWLWAKFKKEGGYNERMFYAFLGGFFMILGARVAGGCTIGHVLAGQMQLALSSFVFTLTAVFSFLLMSFIFYNTGPEFIMGPIRKPREFLKELVRRGKALRAKATEQEEMTD